MAKRNGLVAIDVFAGAGGLTEGFIKAGIDFIAHVEKDSNCCETLKTRLFYHFLRNNSAEDLYYRYFRKEITKEEFTQEYPAEFNEISSRVINVEINDKTINHIFDKIDALMKHDRIKKIDLLVGGPPCQAYSLIGRARDPYRMKNDKRNYLYRYYVEFLKKYRPEIFIFENVPGLLTAAGGNLFEDIKNYFTEADYEIDYSILNSADFMVLQNRKRVILMGWKKGVGYSYPEFKTVNHGYRVRDLLEDLPSLKAGEGEDRAPLKYAGKPSEYLIKSGIRTEKDNVVVHHKARPLNDIDLARYQFAIEKYYQGEKVKYTDFPENLQTQRNKESFLDRFKVVDWKAPCSHTIVAHISKDGHYYIHPDINQVRSLTVREAARIQSFPDNYLFEGPRTSQFIQVGNAVPPLMAYHLALKTKEMLKA